MRRWRSGQCQCQGQGCRSQAGSRHGIGSPHRTAAAAIVLASLLTDVMLRQ